MYFHPNNKQKSIDFLPNLYEVEVPNPQRSEDYFTSIESFELESRQ